MTKQSQHRHWNKDSEVKTQALEQNNL